MITATIKGKLTKAAGWGLACLLVMGMLSAHAADNNDRYTYLHHGAPVTLVPSKRFIAVKENPAVLKILEEQAGLVRDALSDHASLTQMGLVVYRGRPLHNGKKAGKTPISGDRWARVRERAQQLEVEIQPVFEQGGAVLIPHDEITVGFRAPTDLDAVQAFLERHGAADGLLTLRAHQADTFIIRIGDPSDGRCYAVSRALAALPEVTFAEPNHLVVPSRPEKLPFPTMPEAEPVSGQRAPLRKPGPVVKAAVSEQPSLAEVDGTPSKAMTAWTTIAFVDFDDNDETDEWEIDVYNPTVHGQSPAAATWFYTTHRRRSGTYAIYCAAAGAAAVAAPGPAPVNMHAVLSTQAYSLTGYEEVYLDLWFWAANEITVGGEGQIQPWDYPTVHVGSESAGKVVTASLLANLYVEWVGENGSFTQDPTSQGGWMHLLYRVPDDLRRSDTFFEFRYHSDESVQMEGAYIDDIRIVGTTNVDAESLGNDPYGARHWDKKNTGQIAGYGTDANDLRTTPDEAWNLVSLSPDIVVAIIDDGVDPAHPDLNLLPGYDWNGAAGGAPRGDPRGSHGTACAGDAGAIRNNSIGVIGQAPGCKILPVYVWGPTEADIASAISVAVTKGAHVLSNSWGWVGAPSMDITNAINAALAANRVVLFAAGNGPDRHPYTYDVAFPGSLTDSTNVICVGASGPMDEHKSSSSSDGEFGWGSSYAGAGPDVCAPGPWSYTTDLVGADGYNAGTANVHADYTHDFGGTSSSTPKVAGIVALMLSKNPGLTPAEVKHILKTTADPMTATGNLADMTGAGRVNAFTAIQAVPAASGTGSITCTLSPPPAVMAGAQWRVDSGEWENSGSTASGYTAGPHVVHFKAVAGWTAPQSQNVEVLSGQTVNITGVYLEGGAPGAISCTLSPAAAIAAGAQWRVESGDWQNSGATLSGLSPGTHVVSFKAVAGWSAPASQNVNVLADQTVNITGVYAEVSTTCAISCALLPSEAMAAGAQWRVDGGTWQNSGSTVSGLAPGAHTVSFKEVDGWLAPADRAENVLAGQTIILTVTYLPTPTTGAVTCTLFPAEAVAAGAQWRVEGSAWQLSGSTVSGLTPGTHTLSFVLLSEWVAPADQTVNVLANQTVMFTGTYTSTKGSITCTLSPPEAVAAGAQWRVGDGAWQASGATVSGLSAGSHTVGFVALSGWTAPAAQTVTVTPGETTATAGAYEESGCGCGGSKIEGRPNTLRHFFSDWLLVAAGLAGLFAAGRTSRAP